MYTYERNVLFKLRLLYLKKIVSFNINNNKARITINGFVNYI